MSNSPVIFYLIWGSAGRYSDHRSWVASVQFSLEDAERVMAVLQREADEFAAWCDDYNKEYSDDGRDRVAMMTDVRFSFDRDSITKYYTDQVSDDPTWSVWTGVGDQRAAAIECPRCHAPSGAPCTINDRIVSHHVRHEAAESAGVCVGACGNSNYNTLFAPCGKPGCHNTLTPWQIEINEINSAAVASNLAVSNDP